MIKDIIGPHRRLLLICIAISFALYMVSAWHSAIYLHPDEHYQIVEFASYKMGITQADQLAWEFAEQIRPAAQPLLCYTLLNTFNSLGISDHYSQLFLLRILSALLSLLSISLLCISALPLIKAQHQRFFIISSFLFFYPYIYGVHFSSEAWSGCMVMLAVALVALHYYKSGKKPEILFLLVGTLLGVAFLFRFQTALMTIGLMAWLFFVQKERINLLYMIIGGLTMVALGALADHWLYGEWLFVPWRYFDSAFIHKHTDFGDQPFYFFPLFFLLMLTPPIGLLVLVALVTFFINQPRTLYAWLLLPFLAMHFFIPHKEWRFLYPVISFFPLVVTLARQGWREKGWPIPVSLRKLTKWSIIVFNVAGIVIFIFYADHVLFDQKIFLARIHEAARSRTVEIASSDTGNSPYVLPKGSIPQALFPEYMRDKNVHEYIWFALPPAQLSGHDTIHLLCTTALEWQKETHNAPRPIVQRTLPDMAWIRTIAGDAAYQSILANTYYLVEL